MAMVFAKLNSPYDMIDLGMSDKGAGLKLCFFVLTFNNTSVSGVAGQTYDPTNHYTTNIPLSKAANTSSDQVANIYGQWGLNKVWRMVFFNGSSDANVTAGALKNTGECKAEYVESGNYLKLKVIGTGTDATKGYTVDEAEITGAAGNMSALRFTGYLIGS